MVQLKDNIVSNLLTTSLTLSGSWQDVGSIINVGDVFGLGLWVDLTQNDSTGIRFRVQGLPTADAASKYEMPLVENTTSGIIVRAQEFELDTSVSQRVIIGVSLIDLINFVQVQVKATTPGATAAVLNQCGVLGQMVRR